MWQCRQTSLKSGRVHPMGKGFRASDGLVGSDLADIIETACDRVGFQAQLRVILNDGGATLISSAYTHETTRFGLILGTGLNVAAYLPMAMVGHSKLSDRDDAWRSDIADVVVNTEAGMFGHEILPATSWDEDLRRDLGLDLQPLEYMTSGMYLGEVCRRIIVEGIVSHGHLGGIVPPSLLGAYSLSTATMAAVERYVQPLVSDHGISNCPSDRSLDLDMARKAFATAHPSEYEPSMADMVALRRIFAALSRRSAALVAAYVHAAWELRRDGLNEEQNPGLSPQRAATIAKELAMNMTTVAFSGSVVENYPGYRDTCQGHLDDLIHRSWYHEGRVPKIRLAPAKESALIGAGVALASLGTGTCG
jgi:hexokinase